MGSDDDIIIRNGTFSQWLNYEVVFFGVKGPGYTKIEGGLRIKGKWLVIAAFVLGLLL